MKRLGCWARELSVHGPCRPYEVPAQPRGLEQTCPLGKALVGGKGHPPKSLAGQPWETLTLEELQCSLTTPSRGQRVLKPQAVIGCFLTVSLSFGEGNGNPLHCSCLENPRDGRAWWAAICGVAQSRTRLKRLSSSSSKMVLVFPSGTLPLNSIKHSFFPECRL